VPGDFSSAAFWIAAAACREGAEVTIEGVGLNPRRTALLGVLERMGADVETGEHTSAAEGSGAGPVGWEPVGSVTVRGAALQGTEVCGDEVPNLIDEIPLVAVLGAMAEGETVIRDAAELRVKESDRIATMASGLASLGISVEEKPDGLIVRGGRLGGGQRIDSSGDHRVAMAMSVASLFADEPNRVEGVACIQTSYPSFWDDLESLKG
jgi:3-phosphoshikimate 1-carboxyvinyltransferase